MIRYSNLDAVLNHIWDELETAAEAPEHPFRHLTFGTVRDRAPNLRTVVLRRADEEESALAFHSDRRTQKVEEIRANDRIAWCGWDPDAREQIRLRGSASVHLDDEVAMDLWTTEPPESLTVYVRPPTPGTELDEPEDGRRPEVRSEPISEDDVAEGRQHFVAIRTVVDTIEWLHLHPEGHYRARFEYQTDRETFARTWVVP